MGRRIGDLAAPTAFDFSALTPAAKAQLLAQAAALPDNQAEELLEVAEATHYYRQQRLIRYGIGGGAALVLGVVLGKYLL